MRNLYGDLVGAHLVVTDADAKTIRDALADDLDSVLLKISKSLTANVNAAVNAGASIPGVSLVDRIIEEIEKADRAEKTVRKNDIIKALHRPGVVTYRKLFEAWPKAVSKSGRSDLSKPGPKSKPPK